MFNFGRKKEDKDKKRKDKKERQKQFLDGGGLMTPEELSRLSELSRKQSGSGSPEKLPSGITADYRLLSDHQKPRPTSLTESGQNIPPPLPERPPPKLKKSILKSARSYEVTRSVSSELDDPQVLLRNTKANELYAYRKSLEAQKAAAAAAGAQAAQQASSPISSSTSSSTNNDFQDRDLSYEVAAPTIKVRAHSNHVSPVTPPELKNLMMSPIKVSALNGEMTGTKMRPLSCHFSMVLPEISIQDPEELRETSVEILHHLKRSKNAWIIEDSGFQPGDKLIAVNGTNVEDMDKENVFKLFKGNNSDNGVTLHVSQSLNSLSRVEKVPKLPGSK